ncbi:restriction endonuclease subunit S [Nostocoides veronense]
MVDWVLTSLGEFCSITMGQSPAGAAVNRNADGLPLLNGPTEFGPRHPVPVQWASHWSKEAEAGDLLFCVRGSTTGRMNWADQKYAIGRGIASIRGKNPSDTRFARAVIDLRLAGLLQQATGSTFPNLSRGQLSEVDFLCPPKAERERIAGMLGAFDDLIETNRRLATDLENLARALSSRPLGRVPLVDVADVPRLVQRRPEGFVDHYSIPAYDAGYLASREPSESILSGKQMLDADSVLISRLNPTSERTWMVYPDVEVRAVCSPEFAVVRGTKELPTEVLWAFASSREFWDQMRGSVGGTTNSRQRVDKAAIPTFEVPDPKELSRREVATIQTCVRSAVELRREAAAVSSQRDELLPLLMSGKVRVRDAEATVL